MFVEVSINIKVYDGLKGACFMKVLGIISEYNPFHNGHLHHINEAKKKTLAEYVVCVMSGNFVQRGEPSLLNKWTRTRMALENGIDLVIELPTPYCISSAYFFALNSIKILNSLNIVSDFCFGSEVGNISILKDLANVLALEPIRYKEYLKGYLNIGYSYPKSRELALNKYMLNKDVSSIISKPNNILGIEYIKALNTLKSNINPITIKRTTSYENLTLDKNNVSSTAIRNYMKTQDFDINTLYDYMPKSCVDLIKHDMSLGIAPVFLDDFNHVLFSKLRCMTSKEISKINYVSEGFENRLKNYSDKVYDINELISSLHTKRYTDSRIKRVLLNTLLGITKTGFNKVTPSYIRILGFNENGKKLLGHISKNASLPVLINSYDLLNVTDPMSKKLLDIEYLATNLYVLAYNNEKYKFANQDLTTKIITTS